MGYSAREASFSSENDGAKDRQASRFLTLLLSLPFMSGLRGSAKTERVRDTGGECLKRFSRSSSTSDTNSAPMTDPCNVIAPRRLDHAENKHSPVRVHSVLNFSPQVAVAGKATGSTHTM